jgi:hypothetical protein
MKDMEDIIWLSPSLAAGAIAARLVAFFERRSQTSPCRDVELTAPSRPASEPRTVRLTSPYHAPTMGRWRSFGWTVQEGR